MLAYDGYGDCPRPQPPLAAKCDLNTKGAKRGLYPTQPAGEIHLGRSELAWIDLYQDPRSTCQAPSLFDAEFRARRLSDRV